MIKPSNDDLQVPAHLQQEIDALNAEVSAINDSHDKASAADWAKMEEIEKAVEDSANNLERLAKELDTLETQAVNCLDRLAIEESEDLASPT
jgi:prefoldin subunit 5